MWWIMIVLHGFNVHFAIILFVNTCLWVLMCCYPFKCHFVEVHVDRLWVCCNTTANKYCNIHKIVRRFLAETLMIGVGSAFCNVTNIF